MRTARGRGVLTATILGSGMVFLDGTIVNVATRRIGEEFHAGFGALQWVLNAYTLALASLILLGGSLGDRLGRRRIFLIGSAWFAAASLLCAVAPNVETLIAARALQGIGGALLTPGSLAIISATFAPEDRGAAVGTWSGLAGVSTALGPILGGWLVQDFSWRWAFAINLPIAAVVLFVGARHVPETRAAHTSPHLDVVGTVLVAVTLGCVTFGTTLAGSTGWTATALFITGAGVAVGVAFVTVEVISPEPLVPLGLFQNRTFNATNVMTLLTYAALSAVFFVLILHLQVSAGYGPLAAGLASLPITGVMLALSARSGALAARIGPRPQLTAGPLIAAAGLALLLRVDPAHRDYLSDVLPGVLVFAMGLTSDEVGIASGVNNAVSRVGGLLAIAVLPALAGLRGETYRQVEVMVHGYRVVTASCIGLLVVAAAVIALTVRSPEPEGETLDGRHDDSRSHPRAGR